MLYHCRITTVKAYCTAVPAKGREISGTSTTSGRVNNTPPLWSALKTKKLHRSSTSLPSCTSSYNSPPYGPNNRNNNNNTSGRISSWRAARRRAARVSNETRRRSGTDYRERGGDHEAVHVWGVKIDQACMCQEEAMRKEVEKRVQWVLDREAALRAEERRLKDMKREVEMGMTKVEAWLEKGSSHAHILFFR
ncbi:hypothetical protein CVT25_008617 [Psilocybe cyanescens]|uniref:Uncharacterized protein n=1 Tax=Psilocybe cyanescens TaxID=93625 RepID=A0A409XDF5_PSICY|nr:hypothetical protein CVT25_008617 [Psilocybe cyanescens]